MTYDFYFSSLGTNLYTTRDKVLLPQYMQRPQGDVSNADDFYANPQNWYGGLDNFIFTKIPYADPEDQKPIFIQPELRDWKAIRDVLLQTIAMMLDVDERTISSSIVPNAEKPTAREISVDEDTTASFVSSKRDLNLPEINKMINQVIKFYGFEVECVVFNFSRAGLSNINNVVTLAVLLEQNALGDKKSIVELVWPDKSEKQIEEMLLTIEKEQTKKMEEAKKMKHGVEEGIEQQNNNTEYHVPKSD